MPPVPKPDKNAEPDPVMMMNKQMIYLFPLMTIYIAHKLPAALSLYWIITTVFGIIQQLYVNKTIKKKPEFQAEIKKEEAEIEEEIKELKTEEPSSAKATEGKKPDIMAKMLNRRLQKQEKKTGVSVSIRKKK
jgi:membrane protein insertase Oxa1/YidC/SpoIIIJ